MAIIQVIGSMHAVIGIYTADGVEVRIGCKHLPLNDWLVNYSAIGADNDYTPYQIEEYGRHLQYVAEWAKHQTNRQGE